MMYDERVAYLLIALAVGLVAGMYLVWALAWGRPRGSFLRFAFQGRCWAIYRFRGSHWAFYEYLEEPLDFHRRVMQLEHETGEAMHNFSLRQI